MKNPKNILITGANSGLGYSLALDYAASGINLFLTGRNEERLEIIKKLCVDEGANVFASSVDVNDKDSVKNWIDEIEKEYDLDLVFANAGISAGTGGGGESYDQVKKIFDTNIYGVVNTIDPAIKYMKDRSSGQIVIISSLAGYRGLPSSPAYCASKAAVKVYGEALHGSLKEFGIDVTVVTPGYIKTPMTDVNNFYMPSILTSEKAASIIKNKLKKKPSRIAFPFGFYCLVWFISALPPFITDPILRLLPKKPNSD